MSSSPATRVVAAHGVRHLKAVTNELVVSHASKRMRDSSPSGITLRDQRRRKLTGFHAFRAAVNVRSCDGACVHVMLTLCRGVGMTSSPRSVDRWTRTRPASTVARPA